MYKDTNNSIAIQSKQWIVAALIDLMKQKSYPNITIKEIAQHADLDRSTFYRNFKSKEDVLRLYINNIVKDYIRMLLQSE